MKIVQKLGIALSLTWILFASQGCQDTPEACWTTDAYLVDQNADVVFTNCSQFQQKGYLWDFGDGSTSDGAGVIHSFAAQGEYVVSLTSLGKTSATDDTYTQIIRVGSRQFSNMEILSVPSLNPQGNDWDAPGDPADISLRMYKGSTLMFQTTTTNTVPFYFDAGAAVVDLAPAEWTFIVADEDGAAFDTMALFTMDLNTYKPNINQQIRDTVSNAEFYISYLLK